MSPTTDAPGKVTDFERRYDALVELLNQSGWWVRHYQRHTHSMIITKRVSCPIKKRSWFAQYRLVRVADIADLPTPEEMFTHAVNAKVIRKPWKR